jgi:hypothetical protein
LDVIALESFGSLEILERWSLKMGCDDNYEPAEPTPELNVDLLKRVVKRIERDQEMWDQEFWGIMPEHLTIDLGLTEYQMPGWSRSLAFEINDLLLSEKDLCGTKFCFAGHAVLEAGDAILIQYQDQEANFCLDSEGNVHSIEKRAKELLGLTEDQARYMFAPGAGAGDVATYKRNVTDVTGVEFD